MATAYGGSIRLTTPMLFVLGFLALFTIGGLSIISLREAPDFFRLLFDSSFSN